MIWEWGAVIYEIALWFAIQIILKAGFVINTYSFIEEKVVANAFAFLGIVKLTSLKGRIEIIPRLIMLYLQLFFIFIETLSLQIYILVKAFI